jgi:hypothetical protein
MKTCALYGFISALAGAFLTLIEFFLGLHSDASKLPVANWVGGISGLAIFITCLTLGVRARRGEVPAMDGFGYGRALWAGILVSFFSSVLGALFNFAYNSFINPALSDIILQDRLAKLESSGMSGDKLDKAESITRFMLSPVPESVYFLVMGLVIGLIVSLIVAAIVKREAALPPKV